MRPFLILWLLQLANADVPVYFVGDIYVGCGATGATQAAFSLKNNETGSVGMLETKGECGGPVETVNGSDFGVQAYMNTSAFKIRYGNNYTFNADNGGFLGWVKEWVANQTTNNFTSDEGINPFPAFGYAAPYVTADPNQGGALQFTFNAGNLTDADIDWLYDYFLAKFPELILQAGFPSNQSAEAIQTVESWLNSSANFTKYRRMVEDGCRTAGYDQRTKPLYRLVKSLAGYLKGYRFDRLYFGVAGGNQILYDRLASFIQGCNNSHIFFNATVELILPLPVFGTVSVLFSQPLSGGGGRQYSILHGTRLVYTVPPTAQNLATFANLPAGLAAAYADLTVLPYFYALLLKQVSNPYGIPVVSITNELDYLKQPAARGLVYLFQTFRPEVWGGMGWSNKATDRSPQVKRLVKANLTALAGMFLAPNLTLQDLWWHESFDACWPADKVETDTYFFVNKLICAWDALLVMCGNTQGHADTALTNEHCDRTFRECGIRAPLGERRSSSRRMSLEDLAEMADELNEALLAKAPADILAEIGWEVPLADGEDGEGRRRVLPDTQDVQDGEWHRRDTSSELPSLEEVRNYVAQIPKHFSAFQK